MSTNARGKFPAIEEQLRSEISKLGSSSSERQRLGSETELAARFGVARNTLRAALSRLASEGLIYSEPARGWFIGNKDDQPDADSVRVATELREQLASGAYEAGSKFTTAPQIAKDHGITMYAARQVLITLGAQGFIESRHGKGWFVSTRN